MYAYRRLKTDHPDWAHLESLDRLRARFLSYVVLHSGLIGCWIWRGQAETYGKFAMDDGTEWRASRASYHLFVGAIPLGADILHVCDVYGCVCPWHLRPGTDADNVKDRQSRNRSRGRHSTTPKVLVQPLTDKEFLEKYVTDPAMILKLIASIEPALRPQ